MILSELIKGKRKSEEVATAIPAISAIPSTGEAARIARIATIAVANRMEAKPATLAPTVAPFDREWFEERAAILEYDAGFPRHEAERLAYLEVTLWQQQSQCRTLQ